MATAPLGVPSPRWLTIFDAGKEFHIPTARIREMIARYPKDQFRRRVLRRVEEQWLLEIYMVTAEDLVRVMAEERERA